MTIDTGTSEPVSQKPYPIAMKHYHWVKMKLKSHSQEKSFVPAAPVGQPHYSGTKRQWRKMFGNRLQNSQ